MRNSRFSAKFGLFLGAVALGAATGACSRGELSAAEREKTSTENSQARSSAAALQTPIQPDSTALFDASGGQSQTKAPASIEDILKASPLKNAKADCATSVGGQPNSTDIGTQCPTDPPARK